MQRTSSRNFWIGLGILALLALFALPAVGMVGWRGFDGAPGYGYGYHPFFGPLFGIGILFRFLIWGAIIFFVIRLFRRRWGRSWRHEHDDYDEFGPYDLTPNEILRRRYAAGELTREQYEQMRHDLEASASAPSTTA